MRITIKTLTPKGVVVLKQTIEENKEELSKKTPQEREVFYNTWREIITENPFQYSLFLRFRSALGGSYLIAKRFTASVNSAKEFNESATK